jgi:hypothetical protein
MNVDIRAAVVMTVLLIILGAIASIWLGIRWIRKGRKVSYYRLRQRQVATGWRLLVWAILFLALAFLVGRYAEPVAYTYFPPSASPSLTQTISLTPTISLSPTISLTPTITFTPAISDTPTITPTPFLPDVIAIQFASTVTADPAAIFSPLRFSRTISNFQPVDAHTVFQNPVGKIYATFSYDFMNDGAQWTALWYRDGELVHYETEPWKGGSGGYAYSSWDPPAEEWRPGTYQVILFLRMEWKVLGEFRVMGDPPTATPTPLPTISPTFTRTPYPSNTPRPTDTRWPSQTPTK